MENEGSEEWTEEQEAAFIAWMKANPERAEILRRTLLPTYRFELYARNPMLALLDD